MSERMRYVPARPLPARAFIPGVSPREDRPSDGLRRDASPLDAHALVRDDDFRFGADLYNHGFPWEAHEAWEPLWFAAPRGSAERALLQGLIQAAAAAVKARAGQARAAHELAMSALEHLAQAGAAFGLVARFGEALAAWAAAPLGEPPALAL